MSSSALVQLVASAIAGQARRQLEAGLATYLGFDDQEKTTDDHAWRPGVGGAAELTPNEGVDPCR